MGSLFIQIETLLSKFLELSLLRKVYFHFTRQSGCRLRNSLKKVDSLIISKVRLPQSYCLGSFRGAVPGLVA